MTGTAIGLSPIPCVDNLEEASGDTLSDFEGRNHESYLSKLEQTLTLKFISTSLFSTKLSMTKRSGIRIVSAIIN
jgi:hypothetical protein